MTTVKTVDPHGHSWRGVEAQAYWESWEGWRREVVVPEPAELVDEDWRLGWE